MKGIGRPREFISHYIGVSIRGNAIRSNESQSCITVGTIVSFIQKDSSI